MKVRHLFSLWIATTMLAAFASSAADPSRNATPADGVDDPVAASFERELNHEAPQPKVVKREAIDNDELYKEINRPLQTPETEPQEEVGE